MDAYNQDAAACRYAEYRAGHPVHHDGYMLWLIIIHIDRALPAGPSCPILCAAHGQLIVGPQALR